MRRFRALNEKKRLIEGGVGTAPGQASATGPVARKLTKEAEEALVQEKYREAMLKLANGGKREAKAAFMDLLEWPILKEVDTSPNTNAFGLLAPLLYAVCKNLAIILSEEGNHEDSVELFLKAARIDDTEALVLHKLGVQAFKVENYALACYAFEKCLDINPNFRPCLDNMISIQYILGDYPGCLFYVERVLEMQNDYLRGLVLKDEIFRQNPYLKNLMRDDFAKFEGRVYDKGRASEILDKLNSYVDGLIEKSRPPALRSVSPGEDLPDINVVSLGHALCGLYTRLKDTAEIDNPIDLTRWIDAVKTEMQGTEKGIDAETAANATADVSEEIMIVEEKQADSPIILDSSSGDAEIEVVGVVNRSDVSIDGDASFQQCDSPSVSFTPVSFPSNIRRGWKRKRDSQRGLGVFKRRSTRLIPGFCMDDPEAFGPSTTKPVSLCEHLRSYVPSVFVQRDGDETGDKELVTIDSEPSSGAEHGNAGQAPLFHDTITKLDLLSFLEENNQLAIVQLLFNYLHWIQRRGEFHFRWAADLRNAFLSCYELWSVHSQLLVPSDSSNQELKDAVIDQCRDEAHVRLLYAECWTGKGDSQRKCSERVDVEPLVRLCGYLCYLSTFGSIFRNEQERTKFQCRLDIVDAFIQENRNNYDGANLRLQCCSDALAELEEGRIPLEHCDTVVSEAYLRHRMVKLQRTGLLDRIEDIFAQREYLSVIDILSPILSDASSSCDAGIDRMRQYEILLSCFRNLGKSADAALMFSEALRFGWNAYARLNSEEKRQWWFIAGNILAIGEWAFKNDNAPLIFETLTSDQRRNLADSLVEIIGLTSDCPLSRADTPEWCWISPWLILYAISRWTEMSTFDESYAASWYEKANSSTVILATRSLMILWKCHEELGRRKLCMLRNGSLLTYLADEILQTLRHPAVAAAIPSACLNDTLNCAEQCFYCLYKYPSKKKRHLEEHDAAPVELNWSRVQVLFDFVKPDQAPEFDDHPNTSAISADAAQLMHKIESLVPVMLRPEPFAKQMDDFFENCSTREFPQLGLSNEPIISDLFHLLADYYLKTQDFDKAVRYYQFDLCICADRFDSWAGLAMARGYLLDTRLRSMELKYDLDAWAVISRQAKAALYCYQKATSLRDTHYVLLVEYGSMAYQLHSFFSRSLKHAGSKHTEKMKQHLTNARERYLTKAERALTKADSVAHLPTLVPKEEWVHNYLLGKIAEKRTLVHRRDPTVALRRYHAAAYHLHSDGARYPEKIKYTPQRYSLETLEVFYRVHACALKWLMRGDVTEEMMRAVQHYVAMFRASPLYGARAAARSSNASRLLSNPEIVTAVDTLLERVDSEHTDIAPSTSEDTVKMEVSIECDPSGMRRQLMEWCIDAFQLCWKRFSNHFKSHYWLATVYYCVEEFKDHKKSRQLLLGPVNIPGCHVHAALFQHRKPTNFFESIWRIPVDDINRAGSFPEHMFRSVKLLCNVLESLRDYQQLCELVAALHRKPSADKHKYLREPDREELLEITSSTAERILQEAGEVDLDEVLVAAYRLYLALYKMQCGNKGRWGDLLKALVAKKLRRNVADLDLSLALTVCQALDRKRKERAVVAKPMEAPTIQRSAEQAVQRVTPEAVIDLEEELRQQHPIAIYASIMNTMANASRTGTTPFHWTSSGAPIRGLDAVTMASVKQEPAVVSSRPLARTLPPRSAGAPTKTTAVRPLGSPLDLSASAVDLSSAASSSQLERMILFHYHSIQQGRGT